MKKFTPLLFLIVLLLPAMTGSLHAASLTGVTDTASSYVASATAAHTITFKAATANTVAKVRMYFEPGFTLSGISANTVTGITTGTISVSGDTVVYSITYPDTISSGTTCIIPLLNVGNASSCTVCTVTVSTWTSSDTLIDTGLDTFVLTGNSIKFVTPAQVLETGTISSTITIIASDASGNTDTTFNDTVMLSTSSGLGEFSVSPASWQDTTIITLSSGTGTFHYADTILGEFTICASRDGFDTGEQGVKIVEYKSAFISPAGAETSVFSVNAITTVTIPAGSFGSTVCFIINENPTSSAITQADNGTTQDPSKDIITGTVREIAAFGISGGYVDFGQPLDPAQGNSVKISIPYSAAVTGSAEDALRVCRLDENTSGWVLVSGTPDIDKSKNEVSMNLSSLSFYRLVSFTVSSDLSEVIVYPNPFEMGAARDGTLKFIKLPANVTIKIYNLTGELVRTLGNNLINRIEWDGKNERGEKAASGIYFYVITSTQDPRVITGKFAVLGNN